MEDAAARVLSSTSISNRLGMVITARGLAVGHTDIGSSLTVPI